MICNFDTEVELKFDFDYVAVYEQAVNTVLDLFECPYDVETNLLIVDADAIKSINSETRGIDSVTDVLSFPNADFNLPADFSDFDESGDYFEPESGELILGDIVLCYERIVSQAKEFNHSEKREYAFLIVHSLLHLLGFDHIEEEDRVIMEAKQAEIMNILNILRD